MSLLVRIDRSCSNHGTEAESQTTDGHGPGTCNHQSVNESSLNHLSRGQTDDTNTQTSVQKRRIQVGSLVGRHAAIFSGFAVEDEVDGDDSTTEDSTTCQKSLEQLAPIGTGNSPLVICSRLRKWILRCGPQT